MTTTQHTPEPWAMHPIYTKGTLTHWGINGVNDTGTQFTSGRIVDVPRNAPNHDGPTQEANAARIVTCVNACAGMSDPAADVAALREALRGMLDAYCPKLMEQIKAGTFDAVAQTLLQSDVRKALAALARTERRPA